MGNSQRAARSPRRPRLWYFTTAASVAIGIVPIWVLERWFGVPRRISLGYGVLAYVGGTTLVKLPFHALLVERVLRPRLSQPALAASQGIVSALSELGAAAAFFVYVVPPLTWWQLVGFGVGAGATEAIMLPFLSNPLKGTTLEEHADEVFRASADVQAVQWLSVLERVWAMLLQVSTRGLVYVSLLSGSLAPVLVAAGTFATVDGSAYYWHLKRWRFDSLPVLARVHAILGLITCCVTAVFLIWSRNVAFSGG